MLKRAGRYEIVAELGRGGFGQVYRAFDPTLKSMVAIKTLAVDNDAAMLARFRNEAAASRLLRHPNIITIYDFGEHEGIPFIVMELLEGQDLQRVIDSHTSLPLWRKIQIMTQIASGLGYAHAHGIVHRDVKPANVMLLPDGNAKIMDFGIALVSQETQNRLTPRGAIIGTLRYMAPEQFRGLAQDARSDIFAYGLIFYELLSGIHPFHAKEPATLMYNVLNLEPVPIPEVCPGCPEEIQPVIARLLQKDPEFRYQSLEDALFDCEPILLSLKRARARDLFEEASLAYGNRQVEAAQALTRQVMELDPSYPGARELRERLQTELRRLAVRPRVEALANEAREQLAAGNPAEAVQRFEAAARLDPSDVTLISWLEKAKATLELSRQVARLLADGERALDAGDLTGAHRIAQQAAQLAPSEARVLKLVSKAQAAAAEQERQARVAEGLARIRRLIEIRSWDEASSLLDGIEREFGQLGEIRLLRRTLDSGRLADERQQKLTSGLAAARQEIQARSLEAARDRLAALRAEFPDAHDVEQLFGYATSEIEAQTHNELVDRTLRAARALVEGSRFADAAGILQSGLASYPTDPLLQRELRSVSTAKQQAEREAALSQSLNSARAFQAQKRFDEAITALDAFSSVYGPQPAIDELHQAIERDREAARRAAEVREMVRHVNDLLVQGKAEEATRILQEPPSAIKNVPEITELLTLAQTQLNRQMERAAALEDALASANAFRQQGDFDQAAQALAAFITRYGTDPTAAEFEKSIQRDREESRRRAEEFDRLVRGARGLLAEGKALEATQILGSPPSYFKDHPDITRLREEAEIQVHKQAEREAALEASISSATSFEQQGRFDDALAPLEAFVQRYGGDLRVAARQQAIESNRERARHAARIHELAAEARRLLEQGNHAVAIRLLKEVPSLVDESKDLRGLLNAAEAAFAAQHKREAVASIVAEARSLLSRGEFQGAIDVIDRGLQPFPFEAALKSVRTEAVAAQGAKQREDYRAKTIGEATSLIAKHQYDRASAVLEESLGKLGADPQLLKLKGAIEAGRRDWDAIQTERRITESLGRARELLSAKPAESVALMERLCAQCPDRPELAVQLAEARESLRSFEERALIREAERLCDKSRFAEAAAKLSQADRETAELQAARQQVETRRAAVAGERIAKAIQSARETANDNPARSLRAVEELRREFPQHPEIDRAAEEFRAAVRERERRSAIAAIHSLCAKGKFSKARALHQETVARLGADADLEVALAQIEESAASKALPSREPGPNLLRRRRGLVGVAIAIVGTGIWVLTHRTPVPVPSRLPVEIRTDPAGAFVQIGDQSCVTPNCRLNLSPGRYNVQARMNGYASAQNTLIVDAKANSGSLDFTLQPLPPPPPRATEETGTLTVQAGLPGVLVFVDEAPWGRTDSRGDKSVILNATTHRVRVEKSGYDTPPERQVRITKNSSQSIAFGLTQQAARSPLPAVRAGADVRADAEPTGLTDGAPVPRTVAPAPPKPSPADQDWLSASASADPTQVQTYLDKYPSGPHAGEARSRIAELAWSGLDKSKLDAVRSYIQQNPEGPYRSQAQGILEQLERQNREADERRTREQGRQEEAKKILRVLDGFNAAFARHKPRDLKTIWPSAPKRFLDAAGANTLYRLEASQAPSIEGDRATVLCGTQTGSSTQTQQVKITLQKSGNDWIVLSVEANR